MIRTSGLHGNGGNGYDDDGGTFRGGHPGSGRIAAAAVPAAAARRNDPVFWRLAPSHGRSRQDHFARRAERRTVDLPPSPDSATSPHARAGATTSRGAASHEFRTGAPHPAFMTPHVLSACRIFPATNNRPLPEPPPFFLHTFTSGSRRRKKKAGVRIPGTRHGFLRV